jgi:hypothetical protein
MAKFILKKFNEDGEKKFEEFFDKKLKNRKMPIPFKYLTSENLIENLEKEIEIDNSLNFQSAFEFGKYLYSKLKDLKNIRFETGVFHWLTLAFFNQLFPGPSGGSQKIKYILQKKSVSSWKKHLVRLRWELFNEFKEKSLVYLSKPVNNWSDEEESISASPALISSENILDLYSKLYLRFDKNNQPKIISKRNVSGNHREFTKELSIYQLNFDINRMEINELLDLLGPDFKKWEKMK